MGQNHRQDGQRQNNDFYYTMGVDNVYLRDGSEHGTNFDFDVADKDWLKNSVGNRIERLTGNSYKIEPRSKSNTFRMYGEEKDLVRDWKDFHQNPSKIQEATPQQQDSWLAGSFDAKGTFGATEFSTPTITLRNPSLDKLEVAQGLLNDHGIDSSLEIPDKGNPRLIIQGRDNFRKFQEKIPIEKEANKEKLENQMQKQEKMDTKEKLGYAIHPEEIPIKYIDGGDRFADINNRQDAGDKLQEKVGQTLRYTRPNTTRIKLVNAKDHKGKGINPDFVVRHPNGKTEAIEVKLNSKDFDSKDWDYNSSEKIDSTTGLYLEGREKQSRDYHGKPFNYESIDSWLKELENAKELPKFKDEKDEIDKLKSDFKNLAKKAKEVKGKSRSNSKYNNPSIKTISTKDAKGRGTLPKENTDDGQGNKEEEKGGGGKEEKQHGDRDKYQQGDHRAAGKKAGDPRKK
ncbi:MAG: hypothetical protein GPJ52_01695 [Candidatus Heimdallarchaeota archaeon]|nr:hypothetical protein [Candidatus Heimdallarchaeota archaeon]